MKPVTNDVRIADLPGRLAITLGALAIALLTCFAYEPAWHGGFIWDDDVYIVHNELLTAPDGLQRIWFSLDSPSQYFPLVYTTFRIEHALWGLNTTGYHWVNLILHIANALLVWRVLALLRIRGALLAAAIFALHPLQVESVAWITERKNVLMGAFFLLAVWCWIRFLELETRRRWTWYAGALLLYLLALFSKTTACTLPAALLLILWLKRIRIDARRILQVVPFVVVGVAMGAVTVWWERFHQGTRGALFQIGPVERLLIASRAIWFYLGKLFWPTKLTFIYPQWHISAADPLAWGWFAAVMLAAIGIYLVRRHVGRAPEVALVYFVATLSPVIGFIMLYTFRYTFVADHYQYLACLGPIALTSAALVYVGEKRRQCRYATSLVGAAIVGTLAFLTWRQAGMYSNIEALWRTNIARDPHSWMAHNNLGIELAQQGRDAEAALEYRQTVALQPKYPEAHYNLANSLLKEHDVAGALAEARTAVELQPRDPDAHVSLGNALAASGRRTEAADEFEKALSIRPQHQSAHSNLGLLLFQQGRASAAIPHLRAALAQGEDASTRALLGTALLATGDERDAIAQFSAALAAAPDNVIALCNLAWVLSTSSDATLRDGQKALGLAQRANQLSGGEDPVVLRSLAAAQAETGQPQIAIGTAEAAYDYAQRRGQSALAASLENELSIYRRGKPLHQ